MTNAGVRRLAAVLVLFLLAGCATFQDPFRGAQPQRAERSALVRGPALVEELLPPRLADRRGWAEDMHAAMMALSVQPTADNVCAVIAITEQESSFRVDPAIPINSDIVYETVLITLTDGREVSASEPLPRSHWRYPLPRDEWVGKFRANAARVLQTANIETIIATVDKLEDVADVNALTDLIRL